jgi:hypothetical protein
MSVLRYSSKREQILVQAAEEKAKQQAEDWDSLSFRQKTELALTQFNQMNR